MFVETVEAISTGVSVIRTSTQLFTTSFPTFSRIFNLLKNGELKIVVFGAGGAGKSTLGKLLSGEFEMSDALQTYQESISIEQYKLDSDALGLVVVAPGQERRQDTWGDLLRFLADGKIKLIIHVVSWGHHSFGGVSYTQHKLYKSGMTPDDFIEEYTKDCRQRELDVLRKIEPHLSIADQKKTIMITLITKQDLWWDKRSKVKEHYTNGAYETLIQDIRNRKGSSNFVHEYLSASLIMENLISGTNELLVPTTQGYDERFKVANWKNFLNAIETLFNISLNVQER